MQIPPQSGCTGRWGKEVTFPLFASFLPTQTPRPSGLSGKDLPEKRRFRKMEQSQKAARPLQLHPAKAAIVDLFNLYLGVIPSLDLNPFLFCCFFLGFFKNLIGVLYLFLGVLAEEFSSEI